MSVISARAVKKEGEFFPLVSLIQRCMHTLPFDDGEVDFGTFTIVDVL